MADSLLCARKAVETEKLTSFFHSVLSGEHTYGFEPSKITPGGTTFTNQEDYFRLNMILMYFVPVQDKFEQFNRDFKARVESVLKKERGSA
jgi:hypothetical protein